MGRRRSKWKDKQSPEDSSERLLHYAKNGAYDSLLKLLNELFPIPNAPNMNEQSIDLVNQSRLHFLQNTQDHTGATAYHLAASNGHSKTLELLLKALGDQNNLIFLQQARKKYAKTPLHDAAIGGHVDCCRLLVNYGFLLECHSTRGRTPLMYAVKGLHFNVAQYFLVECKVNSNEQNEMGMTALHVASNIGSLEMVQLLIEQGKEININLCNRMNRTPLHEAVSEGHAQVANYLLENGADHTIVDALGVTLWHEAAGHGSLDLFHVLVKHNVTFPKLHDSEDKVLARHPFHYAAVEGHDLFLEKLIDDHYITDINASDRDGCTAVYYAAANGHVDCLKVLLQRKANVNLASKRRSPLHCAVEWNRVACVELMLKYDANIHALDFNGKTPYEIAKDMGHDTICQLFNANKT